MSGTDLASLYRAHGPAIYARCRSVLGDDSEAEDATQEAFMRLAKYLQRLEETGRSQEALPLIYRIATNYCLNEVRNRKHRPGTTDVLPERAGDDLDRLLADRQWVRAVMRHVPEKTRAPAWLHYVDGLTQSEVADVLGVSVRTIVHRVAQFLESARRYTQREAR